MAIGGIQGSQANYGGYATGKMSGQDHAVDQLKAQLQRTQDQLKKLEENENMTPEEKNEKKKELQKMVEELNRQLNQRQLEKQKEEQQKKAEKIAENLEESGQKDEKQETAHMLKTMKGMVRSGYAVEASKTYERVKTSLEGEAGKLEGEIFMDQLYGGDPKEKIEQLGSIEEKIGALAGKSVESLTNAANELKKGNDQAAKEREAFGEEKSKLNRQTGSILAAGNKTVFQSKLDLKL